MTDEELDALVRDAVFAADCLQETGTFETAQGVLHDCATAITTLRAQLAEARAERDIWEIDAKRNHQAAEIEFARADRAEAALAAQIEVDAGIITSRRAEMDAVGDALPSAVDRAVFREIVSLLNVVAAAIRAQPHDRTALDRHDAKTREKALREAYDSLFKHPGFIHAISGQKFKAVKLEDAAEAILALIEVKP